MGSLWVDRALLHTGMACLPSLIGMRGRCAVVEEQDCWLLVVTRCVAGRVALTRQAVVVGLLPRRLDRRTFEPSYHVLRRLDLSLIHI